MTATTTYPKTSTSDSTSLGRRMLNKVPEVTVYFWIIKILCTTVGETAADYLNVDLGLGLTGTSYLMGGLLIAVLIAQFMGRRYVPGVYWLAVVLISIVGTLITDNLVDNYGVALETTTIAFTIALAAVFAAWTADGGLGLGTTVTSLIFLATILGLVLYLTRTRVDETPEEQIEREDGERLTRERAPRDEPATDLA